MITINLSEKQAYQVMCYISGFGMEGAMGEVADQICRQLTPAPTRAAETAAWRNEAGYIQKAIEDWKRKNETAEDAGL
ncbi:hypothetical protein H1N89_gp64 [Escherichia phage egaa]|uniref:Uncharacterized protein n=1 Tax=Escherichia phage egaa TaxID=2696393 RepID=A0A6C6XYP1_9CAUD|nr:hypothetical protein H1N89_gp64 [Escherichia phage egaa]QHR70474.1 hypothetical protein egaa_64 [Escherichia phage egaa]